MPIGFPYAEEVQALIEARLEPLKIQSRNQSGTLGNGRPGSRRKHWVGYEGSTYPPPSDMDFGEQRDRDRIMRFSSYVEFVDLQKDYRPALAMHESVMELLDGALLPLEGIKSPLILTEDSLVDAGSEEEPVYRYRAQFTIGVNKIVRANPDDGKPLEPNQLVVGLWRSPTGEVGNRDTSTLDEDLIYNVET